MPSGSGSQFIPFQKDDVLATQMAQVVGNGATDNSAADNDNVGLFR